MGASVPEAGSHPTGQAELHRLDASRFDPARGFTPGPWRTGRQRKIYAVETPLPVAQAVARERNYSEAEANARLIAAAPELLEALENIRWAHTDETDAQALAAIAKARGQ